MTRAKRYEGQELRAIQWNHMMADRCWTRIKAYEQSLQHIFPNYPECGYVLRHSWRYHGTDIAFDIETKVWHGYERSGITVCQGPELLQHYEPYDIWPSDHLKTKLLLLAG